jgi:esterase/lipase superfamily enzyme
MGNWVAIEALRQMAIRDKRIEPKINSVILAAPDLDVDVFSKQIIAIGEKRPSFILFTSQDDKALEISGAVWGNVPRLGSIDPTQEPYRDDLARERIQAIDLTDVKSPDALGHGKFAENPEVVRMIGARLAGGQNLNDARQGLGETIGGVFAGAATSVGNVATIAVSAPLAVVDPLSRESLGDRVDALSDSVGRTLPFQTRRRRAASPEN